MALGRKTKELEPVKAKPIVAAAVTYNTETTQDAILTYTDESWQREAWGFYDCSGELHFAAEYVGSACALVRLYLRHVDEDGNLGKEVTTDEDPEVASLASNLFGGPSQRAEVLNSLGTALTVAGETFLIGRRNQFGLDEWVCVAPQFCRPSGKFWQVDFGRGKWERLNPDVDIVQRIWIRHKARPLLADSPTRALLLTFNQLQKLRLFMSAELNSRIANGQLYPLPDNLKFPGDSDNNIPPGAPGVAQLLFEAMTSNIEGYGTAAQIAPIIFEAPPEAIMAMKDKPITFNSPLSDHAMDYRKELIEDVARGMNVPAGTLSASAMTGLNHWASWWGTEEFTTKTIAPMFMRICEAANKAFVYRALIELGKDPKRYTVWFDLAPLSNTANQLADALNLYNSNPELLSADTVRRAGNYNESDKPSDIEANRRNVWDVVKRDPTMFQDLAVREYLGVDIPDMGMVAEPVLDELANPGPPPPPVPDRTDPQKVIGRPPEREARTDSAMQAALIQAPSAVVSTAHAVVLAALAVAGRKLRSTTQYRSMFNDIDPAVMHTRIKVRDREHAETLLASGWATAEASFEGTGADPNEVLPMLHNYTCAILVNEVEHSRGLMAGYLAQRGVR